MSWKLDSGPRCTKCLERHKLHWPHAEAPVTTVRYRYVCPKKREPVVFWGQGGWQPSGGADLSGHLEISAVS